MFNAKHYKVIAKIISRSKDASNPNIIHASVLVNFLIFAFEQDNPRFNADTFRDACNSK